MTLISSTVLPRLPGFSISIHNVTTTIAATTTIYRCSTSIWRVTSGESVLSSSPLTASTQDRLSFAEPPTPASPSAVTTTAASPSVSDSTAKGGDDDPPTRTTDTLLSSIEGSSGVMHGTTLGAMPTSNTVSTISLLTTIATSSEQSVTTDISANTSGSIHSSLETQGNPSTLPYNATVIPTPSSAITALRTGSAVISTTTTVKPVSMATGNIFASLGSTVLPPQIASRNDHPVPLKGILRSGPISTNKFYANLFLGNRNMSTWMHPYSVAWNGGQGVTGSFGLAVSHVNRAQTLYGPGGAPSYFINPLGLQSLVISARQLGPGSTMTTSNLRAFSVNMNVAPAGIAAPMITFPLVQGAGFVTAVYQQGTPLLQSSILFRSMRFLGAVAGGTTVCYTVTLMDDNVWFIYMTPVSGSLTVPTLTLADSQRILADVAFSGTLQVAKTPMKMPVTEAQALYDRSAGVYPTGGSVSGTASGTAGTYTLSWTKGGVLAKTLLMFALPHHVASFTPATRSSIRNGFNLQTTTKGLAAAAVADSWTMQENLPVGMDFAPWSPSRGSQTRLPPTAVSLINSVAAMELNEDMQAQTDLNSMYYSSKALAKFATIVWTANTIGNATGIASAGLVKLKAAFARFVNNQQIFPLVYDSQWGGLVSSASYTTGDPGIDFGNSYYNDQHFHYGYFVYTAAVIGRLDPSWLSEGTNKAWVQTLVRDYANPTSTDGYFPFSRMFDWYHGHSWAHGLYETADGKDQESSSEDSFASYAIKMWGHTIGDQNMEARGNFMLAIQARTFSLYYLMQDSNTVQPPSFLPNKAVGILFENKIDHTTYFGSNIEYVEGIHMLPLNPSSTLTRPAVFVQQEWNTYFSNGRADTVSTGWKGILYANLAIIDPRTAYAFFAQSGFQNAWLDGGASRTWYLAWCAGLGGAS